MRRTVRPPISPRSILAAPVRSRLHSGSITLIRPRAIMFCWRARQTTTLLQRASSSCPTIIPARVFRSRYTATWDTRPTASPSPLPQYGTTSFSSSTRVRPARHKSSSISMAYCKQRQEPFWPQTTQATSATTQSTYSHAEEHSSLLPPRWMTCVSTPALSQPLQFKLSIALERSRRWR
jgi:hypothetical protein